jgi:hypothetical protein
VLCARGANESGRYAQEFADWANGWLAGHDTSAINARALADTLEAEAHGATALAHPELQMMANAARAATHASKLSWLSGRARDEENTRAIDLAAEAVHTALRMAQLDLPALADQVIPRPATSVQTPRSVPRVANSVPPARVVSSGSPPSGVRILRALPT